MGTAQTDGISDEIYDMINKINKERQRSMKPR
jgi:hypothetical protein